MKAINTIVFLFLLACQSVFAQNSGISVQGIARDADKAALVDELLTFTFEIQKDAGGTSYYKEDIQIRTDPYGVFSHIIGTGNVLSGSGNFNEIPYSQTHMKLVIKVDYNGSDITVSDSPFQYTPYAKSAENGVPTGTIVAFVGTEGDIPFGWTRCDGRALNAVDGSANLIALIGANAPDLRGMFLRGTGTSPVNGEEGPVLRGTQDDEYESHNHTGNTNTDGAHIHRLTLDASLEIAGDGGTGLSNEPDDVDFSYDIANNASEHSHAFTTDDTGGNETRPVNYGVNYIIKL